MKRARPQKWLELVTDQDTAVYERKIVIIPPKLRHYSFSQGDGSFCLLFAFDKGQTEKQPHVRAMVDTLNGGICTLPLQNDTTFYLCRTEEKLAEDFPASEQEAELLISLLFSQIIRAILPEEKSEKVTKSNSGHMNAIESFINENMLSRITLADVAAHVYLSTRQVSRIITKECGCTLVQLVTEKKLTKAEMLIKNTDMKISEIAAQVNVGTNNYFYTLFKSRYGMSPLQYRKASKSGKK